MLFTKTHSISFESPDKGTIDFCLVKSIAVPLRHIMLDQGYPTDTVKGDAKKRS